MFTSTPTSRPALCATPMQRRSRGLLARLLDTLAIHRQRRRLIELDDALLKDIGLTRDQARREAERPFWDAPAHWLR